MEFWGMGLQLSKRNQNERQKSWLQSRISCAKGLRGSNADLTFCCLLKTRWRAELDTIFLQPFTEVKGLWVRTPPLRTFLG